MDTRAFAVNNILYSMGSMTNNREAIRTIDRTVVVGRLVKMKSGFHLEQFTK